MVYTVTFNPAVDYLLYLDDVHIGEIQRAKREAVYFSGKGINVSKVLNTLGTQNTALGFLAGFTGKAIADALTAEGIKHDFCFLPSGLTRINVKLRHGEETDINGAGPELPSEAVEKLYAKLEQLTNGDALILSGSVPKSVSKHIYAELVAYAEERGAMTVVDADGELFLHALCEHPFLVKPNREELSSVLGCEMNTEDELVHGMQELQARGARNILLSLGGDGSMFLSESGVLYRMGVARGECINSIGAGDSMLAGFLAGCFMTDGDIPFALRLGTAAGAASAFSEGLATKALIDEILRELPHPEML